MRSCSGLVVHYGLALLLCRWLQGCDVDARVVARDVNGPLLEELLRKYDYQDPHCAQLFQTGRLRCNPWVRDEISLSKVLG